MITNGNLVKREDIKYGHFLVRRMQEVHDDGLFQSYGKNDPRTYGVFRIDHRKNGYDDNNITNPTKSYKVRLTPVGKTNYLTRDWYSSDIFGQEVLYVFEDYYDALNWAFSMNNIK